LNARILLWGELGVGAPSARPLIVFMNEVK
jgi:hypothetical protein